MAKRKCTENMIDASIDRINKISDCTYVKNTSLTGTSVNRLIPGKAGAESEFILPGTKCEVMDALAAVEKFEENKKVCKNEEPLN